MFNYGKAECNKKTADLDSECKNIQTLQKTIKHRVEEIINKANKLE